MNIFIDPARHCRVVAKGLYSLLVTAALAVVLTAALSTSALAAQAELITIAVLDGDELTGRLSEPAAVFVDEEKQRLYVADTVNNRLIAYDKDFVFLAALNHDDFKLPLSVGKLKSGEFFILDASDGQLKRINVKERVITVFQLTGVPKATEKFMPGRFALAESGNLYIVDKLNKRIVSVDNSGKFVKSFAVKGKGIYGFNDVRVDSRGYVYGVDTVGASIYIFNEKGKLVKSFGGKGSDLVFPVSVAVSSKGLIYVAERYLSRIMVFDISGNLQYTLLSKGVTSGEVYHPAYVYIDRSDRIYTVDGSRVQVFKEKR